MYSLHFANVATGKVDYIETFNSLEAAQKACQIEARDAFMRGQVGVAFVTRDNEDESRAEGIEGCVSTGK